MSPLQPTPSSAATENDKQQQLSDSARTVSVTTTSTTIFKHSKNLPTPQKIFLLFASQTGQAESISEFIYKQFTDSSGVLKPIEERLNSDCKSEQAAAAAVQRHCAGKYESDLLDQFLLPTDRERLPQGAYLAIIVASTTGQGDPPDTANKFFRWIRRLKRAQKPESSDKPLAHLSYALLGLGDTNYDNFANFGHLLDRHLTDLGAVQYVTAEYADDAVGLELVTEPFIENLTQTLLKHFEIEPSTNKAILTSSWKQEPKVDEKKSPEKSKNKKSVESNSTEKFVSKTTNFAQTEKLTAKTALPSNSVKVTNSQTLVETAQKVPQTNSAIMDTTTVDANLLELPVVSSCAALNNAEKNRLIDLHRQLIEPAASLKEVKIEDLVLPKIVNVEKDKELNCLYKNISKIACNDAKLVSVNDFLKSKLPLETVISEGTVKLTGHLSTPSSNNSCVHQEKTVVECSVDFKLPAHTKTTPGSSETFEPVLESLPSFTPGDAFGIYSSNVFNDVHTVLTKTFVYDGDEADYQNAADKKEQDQKFSSTTTPWSYLNTFELSKQVYIKLSDKKSIVELLPHLFYGVDMRTIAKKAFLAHVAQFTSNSEQQRRLLELSSRQGAADYQALIFVHKLTLVDILRTFTSCRPPLSLLLYYLMASKPRYFSAASLPKLISSDNHEKEEKENEKKESITNRLAQFKILLSVTTDYTHSFSRSSAQVLGLFSGKFFKHFSANEISDSAFLSNNLACTNVWKSLETVNALHLKVENNSLVHDVPLLPVNSTESTFPVYLFPRTIQSFRITDDISKPLILISAGTGIAPFLSLLERRQQQMATVSGNSTKTLGELYFIFGSRHPFQDCTYAHRLIELSKSTTEHSCPVISHLCLCFSRASTQAVTKFEQKFDWKLCKTDGNSSETSNSNEGLAKHVDQLVTVHGVKLVELITQQGAYTYICGDWKKLSPCLAKTFSLLFSEHYLAEPEPSASSPEATKYLKELQKSGRYAVDIWS